MGRSPLPLKRVVPSAVLLAGMAMFALPQPSPAAAQGQYVVQPIAEMKIKQLPQGPLYWRIENFPTLALAKSAAPPLHWKPDTVSYEGSPWLTAEVAGKVWLFTLGAKGGKTAGGTLVAEVGPVPVIAASEYLLRVNHGSGAPGSDTRTYPPWLGSLLCRHRPSGTEDAAWREPRRSRPNDERPSRRHTDGSVQQRHHRPDGADHVCSGRHEAVFGACQVSLKMSPRCLRHQDLAQVVETANIEQI